MSIKSDYQNSVRVESYSKQINDEIVKFTKSTMKQVVKAPILMVGGFALLGLSHRSSYLSCNFSDITCKNGASEHIKDFNFIANSLWNVSNKYINPISSTLVTTISSFAGKSKLIDVVCIGIRTLSAGIAKPKFDGLVEFGIFSLGGYGANIVCNTACSAISKTKSVVSRVFRSNQDSPYDTGLKQIDLNDLFKDRTVRKSQSMSDLEKLVSELN